jgi:hypothetical protein
MARSLPESTTPNNRMSRFNVGPPSSVYDPYVAIQDEQAKREEFERGMGDFFDPAIDEHSEFYAAMEKDKHAAHLVAGTSFLDLNTMILKTECNNAYESMNEDDMARLRKLMWDVYVPHMKSNLERTVPSGRDDMHTFQAQMHVVHISVRVAQALQLIFELNQKKSFSAVAKTAYAVALQDCLYHPHLKRKIESKQYDKLINFLRRHPTYSTPFNTYVGYKLLRQQLVRGGGAGTNRKSNDAERLHDESANRLWDVLDQNKAIHDEFKNASNPLTMDWHRLYYKEVADSLFKKLTMNTDEDSVKGERYMDANSRDGIRKDYNKFINEQSSGQNSGSSPSRAGQDGGEGSMQADTQDSESRSRSESMSSSDRDVRNDSPRGGVSEFLRGMGMQTKTPRVVGPSAVGGMNAGQGVDIVNAIQDSRNTFAEGITKRVSVDTGFGCTTTRTVSTGGHTKNETVDNTNFKKPRIF